MLDVVTEKQADLIFHIGDISYADDYSGDKYETVWNTYMGIMTPITSNIPYMVTPGYNKLKTEACLGLIRLYSWPATTNSLVSTKDAITRKTLLPIELVSACLANKVAAVHQCGTALTTVAFILSPFPPKPTSLALQRPHLCLGIKYALYSLCLYLY